MARILTWISQSMAETPYIPGVGPVVHYPADGDHHGHQPPGQAIKPTIRIFDFTKLKLANGQNVDFSLFKDVLLMVKGWFNCETWRRRASPPRSAMGNRKPKWPLGDFLWGGSIPAPPPSAGSFKEPAPTFRFQPLTQPRHNQKGRAP